MDKSTFSKWGALVVAVLVIAIMIAFASPFGHFVANGAKSTLLNFKNTTTTALNAGSGNGGSGEGSGESGGNGGSEEQNQFTVSVTSDNAEAGTATFTAPETNATLTLTAATDVTIEATANGGYAFAGWYKDDQLLSTNNPHTLSVSDSQNIVAKFEVAAPSLPAGGEVDTETGEILDSWEVIINNVNNGTYRTKYAVGNYKPLDLGTEGVVNMQIAAFDVDTKSGGTDKAHITWIAKELLANKRHMNSTSTNANGWKESAMRASLQTDVWALIPANLQSAIVAVDKTYYDYTTSQTQECSDKVWLPSWTEVGLGTDVENDGPIYSDLFSDNSSRVKTWNGSSATWWLRSACANYNNTFCSVNSSGIGRYNNSASNEYGVAIGFCM